MSIVKSFFENAKSMTTNKDVWKDVTLAAAGAVSYPLIPTAIQAMFGTDMRGWKGAITGVISNSIIAFLIGSPGWFLGTITGFALHFTYARLNEWVVYPVFGQHLFRWDPSVYETMSDCPECSNNAVMSDNLPESEQLQPGASWATIGGKQVMVFNKENVEIQTPQNQDTPATTNTTSNTMKGFRSSSPQLKGFRNSNQPIQPAMSGFRRSQNLNGLHKSKLESHLLG